MSSRVSLVFTPWHGIYVDWRRDEDIAPYRTASKSLFKIFSREQ